MGEAGKLALRVGFDRAIKLEFHGARVSSDAGLFSYRDRDEAAGLTEAATVELFDIRTGSNIRRSITALLRESIYSRLTGYEDVNDAERLSIDPVIAVSAKTSASAAMIFDIAGNVPYAKNAQYLA